MKFDTKFLLALFVLFSSQLSQGALMEIVFAGAPGSGKTTLVSYLHEYYNYIVLSETLTFMREQARLDGTIDSFFDDQTKLHDDLIIMQTRREEVVRDLSSQLGVKVVLYDRSKFDIAWYAKNFNSAHLDQVCKDAHDNSYVKTVFMCESLPSKFYAQDHTRFESYAESQRIGREIRNFYEEHGFEVVMIPFDTVEERARFVMDKIQDLKKDYLPTQNSLNTASIPA